MYGRGDYDSLRDSLMEAQWNCLLNDGLSVDEVCSEIVNKINNGIGKFVPQRNISGRIVHQRKTVSHTVLGKKKDKKKRKANIEPKKTSMPMLQLEIK